jgi:predicted Zn-dependent protease
MMTRRTVISMLLCGRCACLHGTTWLEETTWARPASTQALATASPAENLARAIPLKALDSSEASLLTDGLPSFFRRERFGLLSTVRLSELLAPFQSPPSDSENAAAEHSVGTLSSSETLAQLRYFGRRSRRKLVAITDRDLTYPGRTFVFGQADAAHGIAVVSTYRLRASASDSLRVLDRLSKEISHELGHCFGLDHCANGHCVMHFSPSTHEIDARSAQFCNRHLSLIQRRLNLSAS